MSLELTEHGFFSGRDRGKWLCHPLRFSSFLRFPGWNEARALQGAGGLLCAQNEQENRCLSPSSACSSCSSLETGAPSLLHAGSSCWILDCGAACSIPVLLQCAQGSAGSTQASARIALPRPWDNLWEVCFLFLSLFPLVHPERQPKHAPP